MFQRFIGVVMACVMGGALLGASLSAGAQGVVELISPASGEVLIAPVASITLRWQPYTGAAVYAYWVRDSMGNTVGDGNQNPYDKDLYNNPHEVGNHTQVTLFWPGTEEVWDWYVMAYSDDGYTSEIARSATWRFEVSESAGPTPTPVLPAPALSSPPNGYEITVAVYNKTSGLFNWEPVTGAFSYELELDGPPNDGRRSVFTSDTTITWTDEPQSVYKAHPKYPVTEPLIWRVRGLTAGGHPGSWSEQRALNLYYIEVEDPGDINGDARVDYKDSFEYVRSWQTAYGEDNYNHNADLIENPGVIDQKDLLQFLLSYLSDRRVQ